MKRRDVQEKARRLRSGLQKIRKLEAELRRSRSDNVHVLRHYLHEQNKLIGMDESLRYARHLHDALLPGEDQLRELAGEGFALNLPREALSGDFYWLTRAGQRIVIAVADCTGHGIPGALMSVLGLTFLNQVVREERTFEPSHILRRLDKKMQDAFRHSSENNKTSYDGFDIALCMIEPATQTLHFAGAFRPAWLMSPGEFRMLRGSRYPIGGLRLEELRNYPQTTMQYKPGDMLYLFSDGIVDQFSSHTGKKFTAGRLRKLLDQICPLDVRRQKDIVHETMLLWKGSEPQTDDMMLLGLRL